MSIILNIVIPCYNEQEVLPETASRLLNKIDGMIKFGILSSKSRITFVNDGSKDDTWRIIRELHKENPIISGINLSINRGHQYALLAGLLTVKDDADVVISMDADLQDDIDAIDEMLLKYQQGCDVVYGVRSSRDTDSWFKKKTAELYYRLMNVLGAKTIYNHADYRLLSKRALKRLDEFQEVNLFLRGIIPLIGYKTDIVYYERKSRFAGKSKYPLTKMMEFAWEGITSFSTRPIRMISAFGGFIFLFSLLMLVYILVRYFTGKTIVGWASVAVSVWAIGGLLLLSIGIVGEYIGKIYLETKKRPRYFIESYLKDFEQEEKEEFTCKIEKTREIS
jgi:glycosyltransferase involved in cell wall biosynthesis